MLTSPRSEVSLSESQPEGSSPSPDLSGAEPGLDSLGHPARSFIELHEIEYRQLVQWFLLARVLISVGCLFALLIYEEGEPVKFGAAYALLVGAVALTTAHLVVVSRAARLDDWVVVAVAMDLVFEALLVYLTGGIGNLVFSLLFFGSILSAVLLISERAGFVVAALGIVSLATTSLLYWLAVHSDRCPSSQPSSTQTPSASAGDAWSRTCSASGSPSSGSPSWLGASRTA